MLHAEMQSEQINEFRSQVAAELQEGILPYWLSLKDPQGGFFGEAGADGEIHPEADRGAILSARLVWTFAAAYSALGRTEYLDAARHAYEYFRARFLDPVYGGVFWSVTPEGAPLDTKKQLYAQDFAIYGLSEYYRASGDESALDAALAVYRCTEQHFADKVYGGYYEALGRDLSPLEDKSLSAHDINADKTMNSHLHLLEAYANLYSVWPDAALGEKVAGMLDIMFHKIMHPCGHLQLYFCNDWSVLPGGWSYGHDIETSWLALECAHLLGNKARERNTASFCRLLAAAGNEGLMPDGSMIYEKYQDGRQDFFREWWVQAEAVAGNLWAWKYLGMEEGIDRAVATWDYIKRNLLDKAHGEWYWGIGADGTPDLSRPKAGFWKCPYHNTRMCLQVLSQISPSSSILR